MQLRGVDVAARRQEGRHIREAVVVLFHQDGVNGHSIPVLYIPKLQPGYQYQSSRFAFSILVTLNPEPYTSESLKLP